MINVYFHLLLQVYLELEEGKIKRFSTRCEENVQKNMCVNKLKKYDKKDSFTQINIK